MALYKRYGVWWIDICHHGKRIRQSSGTKVKEDAKRLHDKIKSDLWQYSNLKLKPKRSWVDAVMRWINESQHKRSLAIDKLHLRWVDPFLRSYSSGFSIIK